MSETDGWFEDPNDPSLYRFFDGTAWTDRTMPRPRSSTPPPPPTGNDPQLVVPFGGPSLPPAGARCTQCGSALVEGARFCSACGTSRDGSSHQQLASAAVSAERTSAMWSHLAPLLMWLASAVMSFVGLGIVVGLMEWLPPYLIQRNPRTPFVREHARESLNFQLTVLLVWALAAAPLAILMAVDGYSSLYLSGTLTSSPSVTLIALALVAFSVYGIVQMIQGSVKAKAGEPFRYLINFRLLRFDSDPES